MSGTYSQRKRKMVNVEEKEAVDDGLTVFLYNDTISEIVSDITIENEDKCSDVKKFRVPKKNSAFDTMFRLLFNDKSNPASMSGGATKDNKINRLQSTSRTTCSKVQNDQYLKDSEYKASLNSNNGIG